MKEIFDDSKTFKGENADLVDVIDEILHDYARQGYDLSLRQAYYQLVARGLIENTDRSYKRIGSLIADARLAGLIDWDHIVDRVRATVTPSHWTSPHEIVETAARQFAIDKWEDQPVHVEVMAEKDAVSGILEPVCKELDVPFTANRGYSSLSFMYRRGKKIREKLLDGKHILIVYLGDHDPSGLDMDRDILGRIGMFAGVGDACCETAYEGEEPIEIDRFELVRIALTMKQIDHYKPPPNPAKITDSRAAGYIRKHGDESWELDALEPRVLADLVRRSVKAVRDDTLWRSAVARELEMRESLEEVANDLKKAVKP